jgi:hypothetical protein
LILPTTRNRGSWQKLITNFKKNMKNCLECGKKMDQELDDSIREGYQERIWFWVCECGYWEEVSEDEETLIY